MGIKSLTHEDSTAHLDHRRFERHRTALARSRWQALATVFGLLREASINSKACHVKRQTSKAN